MKRLLVISFSDLLSDPRVRRQLLTLKDLYLLTAVGLNDPKIPGVEFERATFAPGGILKSLERALLLKLRLFERYYRKKYTLPDLRKKLKERHFDLVIANDIDALPFALDFVGSGKVFLDCHEFSPREFEDKLHWRLFFRDYKDYLCRTYFKRCDAVTTVCEGIAEEYGRVYGIQPLIVTNAADYVEIKPPRNSGEEIRLIHHGGALPSRRIEQMIRMVDYLDERFTLTLMLTKAIPAYYRQLVMQASGNPRIEFREPVPFTDIVREISQYDVGVYILEPLNFNNRYALPNKFFEFVQARLAVAVGPSPEMARLIRKHNIGIVAEDFRPQTMAALLNGLTRERIKYFKQRSAEAAHVLSSTGNSKIIREIVSRLLESKEY